MRPLLLLARFAAAGFAVVAALAASSPSADPAAGRAQPAAPAPAQNEAQRRAGALDALFERLAAAGG
ncbi:MAG: hypothetical protein HYS06_07015, partial [Methylocystis sp.]|nr:hypothetical protein [Methylocystis sp.]